MKKNIVLFLLLISNLSFSQSFLYMIENEIKKGNLEIAKKQIAVLNNNNHHFCGNAEAKFKAGNNH